MIRPAAASHGPDNIQQQQQQQQQPAAPRRQRRQIMGSRTTTTVAVAAGIVLLFLWTAVNSRWWSQPSTTRTTVNGTTTSTTTTTTTSEVALPSKSAQYVRTNKRGKVVMQAITTVSLQDLNLADADWPVPVPIAAAMTLEKAVAGKKPLLRLLRDAGVQHLDTAVIAQLPTWNDIVQLYGPMDGPVVAIGLRDDDSNNNNKNSTRDNMSSCARFRATVPAATAYIGTAGLYNTGTNALTYYMRENLVMPANTVVGHHQGILTQVPWDKHWLYKTATKNHTVAAAAAHYAQYPAKKVLPVVIVRDPLTWTQSTCRQPYDIHFAASADNKLGEQQQCPRSIQHSAVQIPKMTGNRTWPTALNLWNDWYNEYFENSKDDQFRLMIRFEDLLFRPKHVLDAVRRCAGAAWKDPDVFTYVVDRSKWEHARLRPHVPQSGMVAAMIRYGHAATRMRGMTAADVQAAATLLDDKLLTAFRYQRPNVVQDKNKD
jgi:hypothetical protein